MLRLPAAQLTTCACVTVRLSNICAAGFCQMPLGSSDAMLST